LKGQLPGASRQFVRQPDRRTPQCTLTSVYAPHMKPSSRSLQKLQAALAHLGDDGLPDYPPPRPWPRLAIGAACEAQPLWVFGYGSLIWNPGFPFEESSIATVHGHHRSLCVWSWEYRGTVELPGLVLGLDHGGSCAGIAYRVADAERGAAIAYLLRRELTTDTYRAVHRTVRLAGGGTVRALTFVVDRRDDRYAGRADFEATLEVITRAHGARGANLDYVTETAAHLEQLGIPCRELSRIAAAGRDRTAG
jgi:cation transport protein ChaC